MNGPDNFWTAARCAAIDDYGLLPVIALDYYRVHQRLPSLSRMKKWVLAWRRRRLPSEVARDCRKALRTARQVIAGTEYRDWLEG